MAARERPLRVYLHARYTDGEVRTIGEGSFPWANSMANNLDRTALGIDDLWITVTLDPDGTRYEVTP